MLALALGYAGSARAQDRSVTIIEGAPEPTLPEAPPPAPPMPANPGVALRTTNPAGVRVDLLPGPTCRSAPTWSSGSRPRSPAT